MSDHIQYIVNKEGRLGPFTFSLRWRKRSNFMGRFGGGWNWKVGAQSGGWSKTGVCLLIDLFVLTVRVRYNRKTK